jgi:hypothetical protein
MSSLSLDVDDASSSSVEMFSNVSQTVICHSSFKLQKDAVISEFLTRGKKVALAVQGVL